MSRLQLGEVRAEEVLDSRSRPTLAVTVAIGPQSATAQVPSGASTGRDEAHELRDGDPDRFRGFGVLTAKRAVNGELRELLCAHPWEGLSEIDAAMVEADGTPRRSRLGGNAIIGVSMAVARIVAAIEGVALWTRLADVGWPPRLPVPHFNVLNGGAHAQNALDFQEFMIAPRGAGGIEEAIRAGAEIYLTLRKLLAEAGHGTGLGDEGGFAPEFSEPEEALRLLVRAIEAAGYPASRDGVAVALDPAASQLRQDDGSYAVNGQRHTAGDLVDRYTDMVREFPVYSIEDGLGEDDAEGWRLITERLGQRVRLVGDDNFVTNPGLIGRAARQGIANAALIKPNQVGTVTTCDDFIADLAVGAACGQLKSGAPARGERVAKYNRLLAISSACPRLPYGPARP
jgi:enolase